MTDKIAFWQMFIKGGPLMWPILLCSVLAAAIIAEKYRYLKKISADTRGLLDKVMEKMKRHDTKEALQLCDAVPGPLANILKAGILKYDRPRQQITEAMEDAALYELPRLQKNLNLLDTIAQISPLLGFLGTAVGMAKCFYIIQANAGALRPVGVSELSGAVWEALLSTVFGLLVAIPASTVYNYLAGRVNNFILEAEKAAAELVSFLTE
jgi:biopolymer transport protein ExbB